MKASSNSVIGVIGSEMKPVEVINKSDFPGVTTTLIFDGEDHALVASGTIRKPTNPNEHGLTSGFYRRFNSPQEWAVAHGRFCV